MVRLAIRAFALLICISTTSAGAVLDAARVTLRMRLVGYTVATMGGASTQLIDGVQQFLDPACLTGCQLPWALTAPVRYDDTSVLIDATYSYYTNRSSIVAMTLATLDHNGTIPALTTALKSTMTNLVDVKFVELNPRRRQKSSCGMRSVSHAQISSRLTQRQGLEMASPMRRAAPVTTADAAPWPWVVITSTMPCSDARKAPACVSVCSICPLRSGVR